MFHVDGTMLRSDGVSLNENASVSFLEFMHLQVCETTGYCENRDALSGTVLTLDENSNVKSSGVVQPGNSTPARREESFASFTFTEDYSTPVASRVNQSGVGGCLTC